MSAIQRTEVTAGSIPVSTTSATGSATLEDNAEALLRILRQDGFVVDRLADRDVAGVTGFVFAGRDNLGDEYYELGALHAKRLVLVEVTYRTDVDGAAEFDARATEPLLASLTWSQTR